MRVFCSFILAVLLLASSCCAFTSSLRVSPSGRSAVASLVESRAATPKSLIVPESRRRRNALLSHNMATSSSEEEETSMLAWFSEPSIPYGLAWAALLAFTAVAPGAMADPKDLSLVQAVIDNPLDPEGVNKLFYFIFNLFAIIPVSLACLIYPQQRRSGSLPATPFVLLSTFVGYFALGPYMTFRQSQAPPVARSSLNWFTRNILENKVFCWSTALFGLYLPFASGVVEPLLTNPIELWEGYVDYWSSSKLGSVSSVDLLFLSISAATLIPLDYQLRRPDDDPSVGRTIGALSMLLPVIGSVLYCAWRPALPEED